MKKVFLSSIVLMFAALASAATYTWENVVTLKLTDGNNDTYTSRFGEASELTDEASWGAAVANLEGATVRAYTVLDGVNYEKLYLQDMTNTALVVKTYESTSLSFELKANYGIVTLFDKLTGATKTVDKAGVAGLETDTYNCTVETNATIENRFILFYSAPTVQLFNEWDDNWATPLNFTNNNDGTFSATKTFTGNGYCPFKIVENGNWLGNGDAFKRDYTAATGIGDGANMTLWVDVPGDYTFTWDFMANALSITMPALPTVQMKGSWDTWADFVDFTPAADGLTASAVLNLDPADWYNFQMIIADEWRGFTWVDDNSNFTRTNNSHDWINAGTSANMNLHADVAGDYTFTWTYVENKLTITFPAVAPANSVTTNGYGFCSFASSEDVEFAAGIEAYKGEYNAGTNVLTLTSIGQIVPAGTGVILYSTSTNTVFNYTTGADASGVTVGTNNFVGVTTAVDPAGIRAAGKEIYCLNGNALKQYVGTDEIPAGKAYLPISVGGGSNNAPKHIVMRFNGTTAVENVEAEVKAEKFVEDGQVYIRRGNEVFNLQGQIVK